MIIDLILDRKEDTENTYNPKHFYNMVMCYGDTGKGITAAMDYGEETDVKSALCDYITRNEYNPDIKNYINSVNWLTPDAVKDHAPYSREAAELLAALRALINNEVAADNFESYLSHHLDNWFSTYANNPENFISECKMFANIEF